MKKIIVCLLVLAVAGAASATVNVPAGYTGLWRFATSATKLNATVGTALTTSDPGNSAWFSGPWTDIGVEAWHTMYSDGGCVQERSWDYLTCTHGIAPNGGGDYVNQYTIMMDYVQTSGLDQWNSLYQTGSPHGNDGDLFTDGAGHIGIGSVEDGEPGYSSLTYDASTWHRIVLSVDNSSFFRVYVDGALFVDGPGQGVTADFLSTRLSIFSQTTIGKTSGVSLAQ